MLVVKSFVAAAVSLALFDSLSLAGQIPLMSFQERMKQSDAVVVGTIEEVHQTDAVVGGQFPPPLEHWLAACHVERYIKAKIHDPDVEEGKRVKIIYIGFVQTPNTKPAPLELVQGKKYLLFLKEAVPRDSRDTRNFYEMITPYDGAVTEEDYSFDEIVRRVTPQDPAPVDIRQQLNGATGYWYAFIRDKALGGSKAIRNIHQEGKWTVFETFGHYGWRSSDRVMTRFLDAEETQIEGLKMVFNDIRNLLYSSSSEEIEEGLKELHALGILGISECGSNMNEYNLDWLKNDCLDQLKDNEDFLIRNKYLGFVVDDKSKVKGLASPIRGLRLSLAADKAVYPQNEPIVLTARLENILPASGKMCSVFPVNARMLIHSEIVFDVRNEKGEYVHFLPPAPPLMLAAKDFRMLDGGQSIESQEEVASRLHEKPLAPGVYRIRATYQNYELGKTLGLSSCAGDSVLLEGGPAWTGRVFSNTVTIEVVK